jgi:hypothetical protein
MFKMKQEWKVLATRKFSLDHTVSRCVLLPNNGFEWLALLIRIQKVSGSYFRPGTDYPDLVFFRGFPHFFQENVDAIP